MNAALHRFALFVVFSTAVLLLAGALVTSNDAGLAVPDWPLSYGSLMPPMVGGVFYEHGHRMIATFVGLLTIALAVWLGRSALSLAVRRLGYLALGVVILQGLLGGLTVLLQLPTIVSVAHASLAQIFFCLVASIALFTSRWWLSEQPSVEDSRPTRIHFLTRLMVGLVFLQLVLGATFRHFKGDLNPHLVIAPHVLNGILVLAMTVVLSRTIRAHFPQLGGLRVPAKWLAALVGVQFLLGLAAYWTVILNQNRPQPLPVMVWATVFHLFLGAVILATAVVLALCANRLVKPLAEPAMESAQERAAI